MPTYNKDYYKILQVDPSAEPEVIAAAYRRLSLKYHPDNNKAADATLRMQEINEAYNILKEPAQREQYDRARYTWTSSAAQQEDEKWREKTEAERPRGERSQAGAGWQQREKAEAAQRRAAEAAAQAVQTFRAIPRGSKAVKVFAREPVYCDGNFFQEHTVPAGYWIDLGFEWIAREVATVISTWPSITVAITVDGKDLPNPKQQSKGPDEAILPCANESRVGYVMMNALYIPPLPLGDHTVIWTIGFVRDVDDGWQNHPRGKELVITSLLHCVKAV
jgi:hypothetical protein